jgi:fructan beta-fructosidase
MNDPNGMVYFNETYHLFYQYYPDSTVWGPMHWGHATSRDLFHWQDQPVALYPDSLGYIFSGSVVVDRNNSSGFAKAGETPLVAIFTHHDPNGEKAGRNDFQHQSIAYSLDEGRTWTKYKYNPVLRNPGIRDFRDPKVMWHDASKKWIMTLATLDRITFYSSPDLKTWAKESEFGKDVGAHGGVWECPDLFPMNQDGKQIWVLLVSINPGGPNGGSATQYFTGQFDGHDFLPEGTATRWLDFGPDDYAGVTWSNTGDRKLFLGWMSNWQYANLVPTQRWRSAMTLPRDLSLKNIGTDYYVCSKPAAELKIAESAPLEWQNSSSTDFVLRTKEETLSGPARLDMTSDEMREFSIELSNSLGEKILIGFDPKNNHYYIDRTGSGKTDFESGFAKKAVAPRLTPEKKFTLSLVIDDASVELFADEGLTVMTAVFFPHENYNRIRFRSPDNLNLKSLQYRRLTSMYASGR